MALTKRKLGNSGLEIAPIVFGGNVFGWTADEATSFQLLDAFVAAGFNAVDTADVYSKWVPGHKGGESETIIGKWLKRSEKRQRVIIATKVGSEMGPGKKGLSKGYILAAVEDSLQRLQTDYIDLYQSHVDDPDTPLEETLDPLDGCKPQRDCRKRIKISADKSGNDAWHRLRGREINLYDAAMRDRTAQHGEIDHAVEYKIIDESCFSAQQPIVLDPLEWLTDKDIHRRDSLR